MNSLIGYLLMPDLIGAIPGKGLGLHGLVLENDRMFFPVRDAVMCFVLPPWFDGSESANPYILEIECFFFRKVLHNEGDIIRGRRLALFRKARIYRIFDELRIKNIVFACGSYDEIIAYDPAEIMF